MKDTVSSILGRVLLVLIAFLIGVFAAGAQDRTVSRGSSSFCSDNWGSGDRESFRELREMEVAAGGVLNVDAGRNGGIAVRGENRSDILIRACVQASGSTADAAKAAVQSVRINTAGTISAEGPEESNYSVSFDIRVPHTTDVNLTAHNGGISISQVEGNLQFATVNGGVHLDNVAGDVRGRTTNGGVNVALFGNSWKGNGLDVQTSNGGVNISIPENYAANIETGTVNGGFSSNIAALNVTTEDVKGGWKRSKEIKTAINGGGAPIRVTTINGGVRINSTGSEKM